MSQLLVDDIVDKDGGNSVGFSKGINVGASSTVTGNLNVTGVLTYEDVTNVDSVGLITARSGIKFGAAGVGGTIRANGDTTLAGVVTATSFSGDGSALSGVSGFGTAFDSTSGTLGNLIFETPRSFYQTGVTSAYINAEASSGNIAFTRLNNIRLGVGATMHIGAGTTLIMNVLNLF